MGDLALSEGGSRLQMNIGSWRDGGRRPRPFCFTAWKYGDSPAQPGRVAAVAGAGGERLETEEEHPISAIRALYSVKRRKIAHCRVCRVSRNTTILQIRIPRRFTWSQGSGRPASLCMFKEPRHEHSDLCHVSRGGPPSLELTQHVWLTSLLVGQSICCRGPRT